MTHILAVITIALSLLAPANTGTVSGIVYFDPAHPGPVVAIGLPPMANWPVQLCQVDDCRNVTTGQVDDCRNVTTGQDGTFSFSGLDYGEYVFRTDTGAGKFVQLVGISEANATVSVDVSVAGWRTWLPMVTK